MHGLDVYADDTLVFHLGAEAAGVFMWHVFRTRSVADEASKLNPCGLGVQKRTREHCTSGNIYTQYSLHEIM